MYTRYARLADNYSLTHICILLLIGLTIRARAHTQFRRLLYACRCFLFFFGFHLICFPSVGFCRPSRLFIVVPVASVAAGREHPFHMITVITGCCE